MKTHIIHLEQHDDLASILDRMTWAKSERILLVFPKREKVVQKKLDLVLIKRKAVQLGSQIAIITNSETVNELAIENGLPVFETVSRAQKESWPSLQTSGQFQKHHCREKENRSELFNQLRKARTNYYENTWARILVFSLAILSLLILMSIFIPSAKILLPLKTHFQQMELTLSSSPVIKSVSINGGLPASVTYLVVKGNSEVMSTGKVTIGASAATGLVTVTKISTNLLTIPEGTVFTTITAPLRRFESTRTAQLNGEIGESIDIPIRALEPGSMGNVDAETILAVEGDLGTQITVFNPDPITGGNDQISPAPLESDKSILRNKLIDLLKQEAISMIKKSGNDTGLQPVKIILKRIISESISPELGTPSDLLAMEMEVEFEFWTVKEQDIQATANLILDANLPPGYEAVGDSLMIKQLSDPLSDGSAQDAKWMIKASRSYISRWKKADIVQWVAGKRVAAVKEWLNDHYDLSESAQIKITPFQMGFLPIIPFRIDVLTNGNSE